MKGNIGVLWSFNNDGGNHWILGCMKAELEQGYVWWDVGWRMNFDLFDFPIEGYMWATSNQCVMYRAFIQRGSKPVVQPDKTLAREVEANWKKLGLPFSENDPLHRYLRNDSKILTLLKLSDIEEVDRPIDQFTLRNGRPIPLPIRSFYYIALP
jgi:hypothetical protein